MLSVVSAWSGSSDPTKANSVPVLDGWGWADYWSIEDWMAWHRAMKVAGGLDYANRRFITEWMKQGIGANPLDARSFNEQFRNYAKANGFFDALYYGLGVLAKPVGAATDTLDAVSDAVSLTADISRLFIPAALILLAGAYVWNLTPRLKRR